MIKWQKITIFTIALFYGSVSPVVYAERTPLTPLAIPSLEQRIAHISADAQPPENPSRLAASLNIPKRSMTRDTEFTPLVLDVTINHARSNDFGHFLQNQQDEIFAYGKDLRSLRIKLNKSVPDNQLIKLSTIPGLLYQYHIDSQSIDITIPPAQLSPYQVDMGKQRFQEQEPQNMDAGGIVAGVLNYNLYNINSTYGNAFSANLEGIVSSDYGNFVTSGLYNNGEARLADTDFVRLDSYWQYVDAKNVRSWLLGDFASNTVEWGSSVRMAGLQVASAYQQRSDIITTALPSYSGSAALPSSLDLYVNQQRIYSGDIPSGPFDIKMLPSVAGNDVTLVTRDANGRQITSTQSWYYTPRILREGLHEYSLDFGIPRYGYSSESSDYDSNVFAIGSLRYGWQPTTTLIGHSEFTSNGLGNIGAGIAQTIAGMSAVNVDAAHSEYKGAAGNLLLAGIEGRITRQLTFNASAQRTYGDYFDAGRVANIMAQQKYANKNYNRLYPYDFINYTSIADRIDRLGMSWSPSSQLSLSAYYNEIAWPRDTYRTLSLNANSNINNNVTLYTNFYKDLSHSDDYSLWVGLRVNLYNKVYSTSSVMKDNQRTSYRQDFSSASSQRINAFGWGASATHYDQGPDLVSVRGDYRARAAWLNAQLSQYGSQRQSTLSATGSLVAADGNVFAANEIGDAFVVVKNAGPGIPVLNAGVDLGKSDDNGNFFISHARPWVNNHIYIDTTHMQEGWEADSTEQVAVSGWRRGSIVDFHTRKMNSTTAKLYLASTRRAIAPGFSVMLNGLPSTLVGYDGAVYLRGVKDGENHLSVDLLDKGICRATFRWHKTAPSRAHAGEIPCQ